MAEEKQLPMGKQETFYRITIDLKSRDYTQKRKELLEKVDFLQKSLKKIGHTGRYGLKGLWCYAPKPRFAYCITSIEHDKDLPWLQASIDQVKDLESKGIEKQHREIDKAIDKYQTWTSETRKEKFIEEEFDFEGLGVPRDKVTMDNFVETLKQHKVEKPVYTAGDYIVEEIFIEPVKPSKREYEIEKQYAKSLSDEERRAFNQALMKRFGSHQEWMSWTELLEAQKSKSKDERTKNLQRTLKENFEL